MHRQEMDGAGAEGLPSACMKNLALCPFGITFLLHNVCVCAYEANLLVCACGVCVVYHVMCAM